MGLMSAPDPSPAEDLALVALLLADDRSAFEVFFDRFFQRLYRFALARLDHDVDLAEEMAQMTICRAFEKLETYRGEGPLDAWMMALARSEISGHFRQLGRRPTPLPLDEATLEQGPGPSVVSLDLASPESQSLRRETIQFLHQTLDQLPGRYGDVLEWKYAERLSVNDIAGRLGLTAKAAESLLGRARRAFYELFHRLGGEGAKTGTRDDGKP